MSKTAKDKKKSNQWQQIIILLVVLVVLVVISLMTALVSLGVIDLGSNQPPVNSLVDAEPLCEAQIRDDYSDQLNSFFVDDRSSRHDTTAGEFKLFYQIQVYLDETKTGGVQMYHVNCFVSAERGTVSEMKYYEDADFNGKPIRRTKGNAFGM